MNNGLTPFKPCSNESNLWPSLKVNPKIHTKTIIIFGVTYHKIDTGVTQPEVNETVQKIMKICSYNKGLLNILNSMFDPFYSPLFGKKDLLNFSKLILECPTTENRLSCLKLYSNRFEFREVISPRDPRKVYNSEEDSPLESISIYSWKKITEWREKKEGNVFRKVIAEGGYLGSGITGVVESAIKLPICYIIGNPISGFIARGINFFRGGSFQSYKKVKQSCNQSFDKSIQGVVQNFVSLGTNIVSHEKNIKTAVKVKNAIEGGGEATIEFIENISPTSIASVVLKRDIQDIYYDSHSANGNYDPRPVSNLLEIGEKIANSWSEVQLENANALEKTKIQEESENPVV